MPRKPKKKPLLSCQACGRQQTRLVADKFCARCAERRRCPICRRLGQERGAGRWCKECRAWSLHWRDLHRQHRGAHLAGESLEARLKLYARLVRLGKPTAATIA